MGQLLSLKRRRSWGKAGFTVLIALVAAVMVVPLLIMLSGSLKTPGEFAGASASLIPEQVYWGNYKSVIGDKFFFRYWYLNSLYVVVTVIALRLAITVSAAYAFAKLDFPFKNVLFFVVMGALMIPTDTTLVGRFLIYRGMGIIDTHLSIILPAMADVLMLFMVRQFFMTLPKELDEAALIDGCGHLQIYTRIVIPLAKPVIMTVILFTFIWTWNDYTNPSVFISNQQNQLLTVGLTVVSWTERGTVLTRALAGAILAIVPTIALFSLTQRFFVQGIAMSGIKG